MQELEKILEEIEEIERTYTSCNVRFDQFVKGLKRAEKVILKHMTNNLQGKGMEVMNEKRCPVGGVDRAAKTDRITLETAVETPFWMAIWATEPDRMIEVKMSYSDLKIICDLIDNERSRRKGEQNETD